MRSMLALFAVLFALTSCSMFDDSENYTPKGKRDRRKEDVGRLTGEGIILSGDKSDAAKEGGVLGVNSYLWRASLDTLSFMPLVSADPFGGVIITDWYEDPKTPGERFKINVIILDKTLRADGVKLTVFKQKMEKGGWRDQKVDNKLTRTLEDTILTRARQLRASAAK